MSAAAWLFWPGGSAAPSAPAAVTAAANDSSSARPAAASGFFARKWGEAAPPPDRQERMQAMLKEINTTGPQAVRHGDLQNWWRNGLAQCRQLGGSDCERVLRDALASWSDRKAAAIAAAALDKQSTVADAETHLVQNMNTPLLERLGKLSALRKSLMGDEAAQAWYGRDEAAIGFAAAVNAYAQGDARKVALAQRMTQVEALRQQYYGPYYAELKAAEGAQTAYALEYGLAKLDVKDVTADTALRNALRNKYLSPADATAQAQQDAQAGAQQARVQAYQSALAELERRYADHDNSAYLAEVAALRRRMFE
ncbi:lipase secretion chaperone [Andreprevotia lacus]|nr:lipase secretion chaperone [Andreprevotia lacus]